MILSQDVSVLSLSVTQRFNELLSDNNIYSSKQKASPRLKPGDIVWIAKDTTLEPYCAFLGSNIFCEMGAFSYTNAGFPQHCLRDKMRFGRYCSIARGLHVPYPQHPLERVGTSSIFYARNFSIASQALQDAGVEDAPRFEAPPQKPPPIFGHDVWIGDNATVNPGVQVGNGAVIAAEAVVVKHVPDFAIVGGNPASVIRYRFPEDIQAALLELEWWKYHISDLRRFAFNDPPRFIKRFRREKPNLQPYRPKSLDLWKEVLALAGAQQAARSPGSL